MVGLRRDAFMHGCGRKARALLLFALILCAPACNTQNPSYFPYLLPFGHITETHAKPPGAGYYANFDPYAVRLEVRPLKDVNGQDITNQTRTQHLLIATVYDDKGTPRRERRVEWMIEGAGHILEVDESGYSHGRGYKTSDKHAVSYTNRDENRLTRGDKNKENDVMIRPGQTWCLLTSAVEGDTVVTVYAPGIADWEKNKVYTTIRWADVVWEFPQPAQKPAGSEHSFITRVARASSKQPLANYRVRYRIKDGPAAYFLPDKTQEYTAVSDLSGNAEARITLVRLGDQVAPPGVNNVDIEIVRPPDPSAPSGSGVVVARGTSYVEWVAPNVVLAYTGPPAAMINEEITYTATLQNTGRVPSDGITLSAPTPRGMDFIRSVPPPMGNFQGEMLFTLGALQPGQSANVQLVFRAKELGQTSSVISMKTGGQSDRKEVVTNIADAKINVSIEGPQRAAVNQTVPLTIKVTNTGGSTLNNIALKAELKGGLVDPGGNTSLQQTLKNPLGPGQTYTDVLNVVPKAKGRAEIQVIAATGALSSLATHAFDVTEPTVSLSIDGPKKKYVGRDAEYTIKVTNPGDAPLTNVFVRDLLPPELDFVTAQDGQFNNNREVVWNLGSLGAGQSRDLKLVARCRDKAPAAEQRIVVSSDNAAPADQRFQTEVFGAAGLRLEMKDLEDPVPPGGNAVYEIVITNTGTDDAKNVGIAGEIYPGLAQILQGSGPTQINITDQGKKFEFQRLTLKPGDRQVFRVTVRAGNIQMDGLFRCALSADSLDPRLPAVIEDENTRIGAAAPGAPPPPPFNGGGGGPFGNVSNGNNGLTPPPPNQTIPSGPPPAPPVPPPPMAP